MTTETTELQNGISQFLAELETQPEVQSWVQLTLQGNEVEAIALRTVVTDLYNRLKNDSILELTPTQYLVAGLLGIERTFNNQINSNSIAYLRMLMLLAGQLFNSAKMEEVKRVYYTADNGAGILNYLHGLAELVEAEREGVAPGSKSHSIRSTDRQIARSIVDWFQSDQLGVLELG